MPVTLRTYFETQYVLFRRLREPSADNVRRSLTGFAVWLGHDPKLLELSDEMLSKWVVYLEAAYAPKTAHNKRSDVLGVWTDAFAADRTGTIRQPRRVRTVPVPDPEPDSWSDDEVARLVVVARQIAGRFPTGVPRAVYFEATIRAAWETGLRRGDLWALRLAHIGPDGTIQKTQSKTGVQHCGRIEPETLGLLHRLARDPPLAPPGDISAVGYWLTRVRTLAGLGPTGQLQRIRASAATNVAIHQPGAETGFLGHTSPRADKWYIDRKRLPLVAVCPSRLNLPPPIG